MFNFISGGMSYSIAWANGNNSDTPTNLNNINLREFPLDWDIRHFYNLNATFRVGRGEEWIVPLTNWIFPVDDFFVSINYNISSGRPYTPIAPDGNQLLETNSKRMPYTSTADLRVTKNFQTGGNTFVRATFSVENLFKKENVNSVHRRTGSPFYSGVDIREPNHDHHVFPEVQFIQDLLDRNPTMVNNVRSYIFGLSYNF
jgi:hypothetical protein